MSESPQDVKKNNLDQLKVFLFNKGAALKSEMSDAVGLSTVTINSLVKDLVADSTFIEGESVQQKLGRPAIRYYFNYDLAHFLLLSLEQVEQHLVIKVRETNMQGKAINEEEIDFSEIRLENLTGIFQQLMEKYPRTAKIGVSFPGKIYEGVVTTSWFGKMDGWRILDELQKAANVPVIIDNDANVVTVGFCRQRPGLMEQTVVGIYYPYLSMPGICIFTDSYLFRGNRGLAGEPKFLSFLGDEGTLPSKMQAGENLDRLLEIIAIYNAVIAPRCFVIYMPYLGEMEVLQGIAADETINKHPNKPDFYYGVNFEEDVFAGLQGLVLQDTIFEHSVLEK